MPLVSRPENPAVGEVYKAKLVGLQAPKPLTPKSICFYVVGGVGMNLTGNK